MKAVAYSIKPFEKEFLAKANQKKHDITLISNALGPDTAVYAEGKEAVIVFTNDDVSAPVIEKLAGFGIKYIVTRSVGTDHIDKKAAAKYGIKLANVPSYSPQAIAEHAVGLAFALNRQISKADQHSHHFDFRNDDLIGYNFSGKTVGLIGLGNTGQAVGRIYNGMGCKVIGYDMNFPKDIDFIKSVTLPELLSQSDIISLHLPLSPKTTHFINKERVDQMKHGVMLINTSRGAVIKTTDVLNGLLAGKIGYLGLDVYEFEKGLFFENHENDVEKDQLLNELMKQPNVIVTPHQAYLTKEALQEISNQTIKNLDLWQMNKCVGKAVSAKRTVKRKIPLKQKMKTSMSADHQFNHFAVKYNVPVPRYTSYPTMPYWDNGTFDKETYKRSVMTSFNETNEQEGISLYIHLPFCESLCTYCGCNTRITKNHRVEEPYIDAVLTEWKMYRDLVGSVPTIREIHLGGGTPTFFSAENLHKLIGGLIDGATIHKQAGFSFEAHPANTTVDHLQTLYDLGFRRLSLGIQDFDPKVQFIINRHQTFEQVRIVTEQARRIGYNSINYDLIYGLPLQTFAGLTNTMMMVADLLPDRIAFYSYAHVPWIKPGQRRFTEKDLPDAEAKSRLYQIGRALLKSYGYLEIGMDHFALKGDELLIAERSGKLHRNFMGYTNQHTQLLIGLGVSSINDSLYCFAQNSKVLEEYLQLIAGGDLPVVKGHILTYEDLIIRKHILNIMCKGHTTWNHHTEPCDAIFEGLERLQPLADDGLIELNSWGLQVTPLGKPFVRNICMALDARLWADKPASQLFSMAI